MLVAPIPGIPMVFAIVGNWIIQWIKTFLSSKVHHTFSWIGVFSNSHLSDQTNHAIPQDDTNPQEINKFLNHPLSLINRDAKIRSKALALRIISLPPSLPYLNHLQQLFGQMKTSKVYQHIPNTKSAYMQMYYIQDTILSAGNFSPHQIFFRNLRLLG